MRQNIARIAIAIAVSLLLFLPHSFSQDLTPKGGTEIIPEKKPSPDGSIPSHLSLEEQAFVFAKRKAKKLGLDNVQTMKLSIRRIAYLKKVEKMKEENTSSSIEDIEMRKKIIDREFHYKFLELLNPEQKRKELEIEAAEK